MYKKGCQKYGDYDQNLSPLKLFKKVISKKYTSLNFPIFQVSIYVMSKFKYFYVHNLVEYFQMETRWTLRKLLIENFMLMCSIESVIISLMLNSVLPLELAQDLYQVHVFFNR